MKMHIDHLEFNDVYQLRFFRTVNALLKDTIQFTNQSFNFWLLFTLVHSIFKLNLTYVVAIFDLCNIGVVVNN